MDSFWAGFFENLRERGRNATLFIVVLAALIGVLLLSGVLEQILNSREFGDYARIALAALGLSAVVWFGRVVYRSFSATNRRSDISRLSNDELSKARSKLRRSQKRGNT